MKKKFLVLLALSFLNISCKNNTVYHKTESNFDTNRWAKEDTKTFDFSIEEDTELYDIALIFSHVYDYQFETVPLQISIFNPMGEEEKLAIDLTIKDNSGKDVGDCSGDFCDIEYILKTKTKLQKGNYKVVLTHNFEGPYLPNILGIGLNVKKIEKKL